MDMMFAEAGGSVCADAGSGSAEVYDVVEATANARTLGASVLSLTAGRASQLAEPSRAPRGWTPGVTAAEALIAPAPQLTDD
jgi:hypothetical protein